MPENGTNWQDYQVLPVTSKENFVGRYQANEFGNRAPTWNIDEWMKRTYDGSLYHLRNRVAGGKTFYNLNGCQVLDILREIKSKEDWYISAMAPTEHTLIQGELSREVDGLYLRYNNWVRKPMREALADGQKHVWGIAVQEILRYYLDPRSFDWIHVLLDRYPDHVIEFSCYGIDWGTIPGLNTVIWEIRKY